MTALDLAFPTTPNGAAEPRLAERAYQALRRAIRELRLPPGKMVLEQELAEVLEMSRTPVREALVRLASEGLARLVPRHGFEVAPLAADELQEIYEIIEGLEGQAVALAAERATPQGIVDLEALLESDVAALADDDLPAWVEADDQFHHKLVELSGNARLRQLVANYDVHLYRARLATIRLRPKPTRSAQEHRAVVEAVRAGDPARARALHQAHRRRAREEILGILRALTPVSAATIGQELPRRRTESSRRRRSAGAG
jgi:DNA-binding GntR family transcriptional regulator